MILLSLCVHTHQGMQMSAVCAARVTKADGVWQAKPNPSAEIQILFDTFSKNHGVHVNSVWCEVAYGKSTSN